MGVEHRYQKILLVGQNLLKNKILQQFKTRYELKFSNLRPLLFIFFPKGFQNLKSLDIRLWEVGPKKTFIWSEQIKKIVKKKKIHGNFTPFMSKTFQIWNHLFSLLFPKDSENLKSLGVGLWEVGAKRLLKGVRNNPFL